MYTGIKEGRWRRQARTHVPCTNTHHYQHFNSRVVVSSLITLDNNLIRKHRSGIHCFSLITYPHLPVYPLPCSPLHGPLSNAPTLSISFALCQPPSLSFTPAELFETPLQSKPTCLTWTVLFLTTLSKRSSILLHSSSCSWALVPTLLYLSHAL